MNLMPQLSFPLAGFRSWSNCTTYKAECEGCTGCTVEQQRQEAFPVFPALLNAVHQRGIKIRILTNNFTIYTCPGKIAPLDWLVLNNIEVKFYTTTTFQHAKFIVVDKGKKTAVSSVNFSYTSFLLNRESGVILEDCDCSVIDLYQSVFEYDWGIAEDYVLDQTYSSSDMKIITDPAVMPYVTPNHNGVAGAFVTQSITYSNVAIKKGYTSPDNARDTMMSYFPTIKRSLQVSCVCCGYEGRYFH